MEPFEYLNDDVWCAACGATNDLDGVCTVFGEFDAVEWQGTCVDCGEVVTEELDPWRMQDYCDMVQALGVADV